MAKKIFLIRHGETDANCEKRYLGNSGIGLNDNGRRQAISSGLALQDQGIQRIYSSDSPRALEFAELCFVKRTRICLPQLREMNFGVFEGLTHEQLMQGHPDAYPRWLSDPENTPIPGGEDLPGFRRRVLAAFDCIIADNPDGNIAIVTHGGPLRAIVNRVTGSRDFWKFVPAVAGVTMLECEGQKMNIVKLNDTAHLA